MPVLMNAIVRAESVRFASKEVASRAIVERNATMTAIVMHHREDHLHAISVSMDIVAMNARESYEI